MQKLLLAIIGWYQTNGGGERLFAVECNFEPTCSEYARQAVERFGAWKGGALAIKRIRRCNNRDLTHVIRDEPPSS